MLKDIFANMLPLQSGNFYSFFFSNFKKYIYIHTRHLTYLDSHSHISFIFISFILINFFHPHTSSLIYICFFIQILLLIFIHIYLHLQTINFFILFEHRNTIQLLLSDCHYIGLVDVKLNKL